MVERVHHIDFVVRDLDEAVAKYSQILGRKPRAREQLEYRGVELARFEVGDIWIILVQPIRDDSPVRAFLDQHGEGFFHIAYKVTDVVEEAQRIKDSGVRLVNVAPRPGVEGWKLIDLAMEDTAGVLTQLIEETS